MDSHATKIYKLAVEWLEKENFVIDHNILEYTCKYHKCSSDLTMNDKFRILSKLFGVERVKIIIQLITVLNEKPGGNNVVWKPYVKYLEALRYAESVSDSL